MRVYVLMARTVWVFHTTLKENPKMASHIIQGSIREKVTDKNGEKRNGENDEIEWWRRNLQIPPGRVDDSARDAIARQQGR